MGRFDTAPGVISTQTGQSAPAGAASQGAVQQKKAMQLQQQQMQLQAAGQQQSMAQKQADYQMQLRQIQEQRQMQSNKLAFEQDRLAKEDEWRTKEQRLLRSHQEGLRKLEEQKIALEENMRNRELVLRKEEAQDLKEFRKGQLGLRGTEVQNLKEFQEGQLAEQKKRTEIEKARQATEAAKAEKEMDLVDLQMKHAADEFKIAQERRKLELEETKRKRALETATRMVSSANSLYGRAYQKVRARYARKAQEMYAPRKQFVDNLYETFQNASFAGQTTELSSVQQEMIREERERIRKEVTSSRSIWEDYGKLAESLEGFTFDGGLEIEESVNNIVDRKMTDYLKDKGLYDPKTDVAQIARDIKSIADGETVRPGQVILDPSNNQLIRVASKSEAEYYTTLLREQGVSPEYQARALASATANAIGNNEYGSLVKQVVEAVSSGQDLSQLPMFEDAQVGDHLLPVFFALDRASQQLGNTVAGRQLRTARDAVRNFQTSDGVNIVDNAIRLRKGNSAALIDMQVALALDAIGDQLPDEAISRLESMMGLYTINLVDDPEKAQKIRNQITTEYQQFNTQLEQLMDLANGNGVLELTPQGSFDIRIGG